jgi:parvulin-like peptidyl-prolyl isomerase
VDGITIPAEKLVQELDRRGPGFSSQASGQEDAVLEEMVRFGADYVSAIKAGYDKDPKVLEAVRNLIVDSYRNDVLYPRLESVEVIDDELHAYYDKHKSEFTSSKSVHAAIIYINVPQGASKGKSAMLKERADAARVEALALPPSATTFGGVAVKYSDDQATRYRGGDAGWFSEGSAGSRWEGPVMDAVFALGNTGGVSPVVETLPGYYIVKLMEVRPPVLMPFDEASTRIRRSLLEEKKASALKDYYDGLMKKVPVKVNSAVLEKVKADRAAEKGKLAPPPLPAR